MESLDQQAPDTPSLPAYADDLLARLSEAELVAILYRDGDRVPRNVIDACAARGDAMVQALQQRLNAPEFPDDAEAGDAWWLTYHAAMIAGLVPGEAAGQLLVHLMRRMIKDEDEYMQEWLAGYWPALFANKPADLADDLRVIAEERDLHFLPRVHAAESFIRLAWNQGSETFEAALDWLAERAADEDEDWLTRLSFSSTLLDFPRERHRPLLDALAARQSGFGRRFDAADIDRAYDNARDEPDWDRFSNPWRFYEPNEIQSRQRRWAEEKRRAQEWLARRRDESDQYVRPEPKVGRNVPCPCGSGKKHKKCCLGKE